MDVTKIAKALNPTIQAELEKLGLKFKSMNVQYRKNLRTVTIQIEAWEIIE